LGKGFQLGPPQPDKVRFEGAAWLPAAGGAVHAANVAGWVDPSAADRQWPKLPGSDAANGCPGLALWGLKRQKLRVAPRLNEADRRAGVEFQVHRRHAKPSGSSPS